MSSTILTNLLRLKGAHWSKVVLEVLAFHEEMQEIKGKTPIGAPKDNQRIGWSITDTADALHLTRASVCRDLQLARALRADPKLALYKNKSVAFSTMKGK